MPQCLPEASRQEELPHIRGMITKLNVDASVYLARKGAKGQKSRSPYFQRLQEKYMDHRRGLKKSVRKSKLEAFKQRRDSADNDIWGKSYRLVMTKDKTVHDQHNQLTEKLLKILCQRCSRNKMTQ